jgi:hypothetical protein
MEKITLEHGSEVVIFDKEKLIEVVKRHAYSSLDEFLEKKTYDGVEYILNYYSDTIIDMYKK